MPPPPRSWAAAVASGVTKPHPPPPSAQGGAVPATLAVALSPRQEAGAGHDRLLLRAASDGRTADAALLLDRGAGVGARDMQGRGALALAAGNGHTATAALLLDRGADPEPKDDDQGDTALVSAARQGFTETAALLLDRGADIVGRNKGGATALCAAVQSGHTATAALLLDRGAAVGAKINNVADGYTPLMRAAVGGHTAMAALLLRRGAVVGATAYCGHTALMLAAQQGHTATAALLLEHGADIEAKDQDGCAALMHAARSGHTATAELLLDLGADAGAKNNEGYTALKIAATHGHPATVALLLDRGSPCSCTSNWSWCTWCAEDRNMQRQQRIIRSGRANAPTQVVRLVGSWAAAAGVQSWRMDLPAAASAHDNALALSSNFGTPATQATQAAGSAGQPAVVLWFLVRVLRDYEPGLVAIVKAILEAQIPSTFTHLQDGGTDLEVTAEGRRVTLTRTGYGNDVWAIASPGALDQVRCWRVMVHKVVKCGVVIGIIGTTDPGDVRRNGNVDGLCLDEHATGYGWTGCGDVFLAGENHGAGRTLGWPRFDGWKGGDEAALRVDRAASTVTLKHHRLGQSFTLQGLDAAVEEWFVNVRLHTTGESVEVQPLTAAAFEAF